MQLARVSGTVVATQKFSCLEGARFLLVQPLHRSGAPSVSPVVAADGVHMAGPGELLYFVAARQAAREAARAAGRANRAPVPGPSVDGMGAAGRITRVREAPAGGGRS